MRNIEAIIQDIDDFMPVNDEWKSLDELIEEACGANDRRLVKSLLGLFERFPDHDGYGVFWSIVHGLEAIGGYETDLASSVLSKPHELSVLMLNRMLNGGIHTIDGRPIIEILEQISGNFAFSRAIRESAGGFVAYQRKNM
jgi:hypothetical protein